MGRQTQVMMDGRGATSKFVQTAVVVNKKVDWEVCRVPLCTMSRLTMAKILCFVASVKSPRSPFGDFAFSDCLPLCCISSDIVTSEIRQSTLIVSHPQRSTNTTLQQPDVLFPCRNAWGLTCRTRTSTRRLRAPRRPRPRSPSPSSPSWTTSTGTTSPSSWETRPSGSRRRRPSRCGQRLRAVGASELCTYGSAVRTQMR